MRRRVSIDQHPVLFVEGLKLRPTGLRVLRTLPPPMTEAQSFQPVMTTCQIAAWSGLTAHVVRARLCELRRRGLIVSGRQWSPLGPPSGGVEYGHRLSDEGVRRAAVA